MYRLYLDEHGTDTMNRLNLDGCRYLSLTGVVMQITHARDFLGPQMDAIKAEIFNHDPDQPLHFHRSDIRHRKGPFEVLRNEKVGSSFNARLLQLMSDCEYRTITVFIDKRWMLGQVHWEQTHPYHFLMEVMIEKYAQYLRRMNATGDIMPEARGKPQDKALQKEADLYRQNGTRFLGATEIQNRIPFRKLKFRTKLDNIAGLQLCDLLAHPSHYTVRENLGHKVTLGAFGSQVSDLLVMQKYDRSYYGDPRGYGFKHIP